MDSTSSEPEVPPRTSWLEFEPRHSEMPLPEVTFFGEMKQMPWQVKVAVIYELVVNVTFHVINVLVLIDLHLLNYEGLSYLILEDSYYDSKAHFWTLYGCSVNLNLHTTSVLLWGLLVFAIGKGDPSWAKAWVMMKRIVIFLMLPHNAAIAFGGGNSFAIANCIFFFFYYLLSVLTIELVTRYYIPPENSELAPTGLLTT